MVLTIANQRTLSVLASEGHARRVRMDHATGVLMLRLHAAAYHWKFVPVTRALFDDATA